MCMKHTRLTIQTSAHVEKIAEHNFILKDFKTAECKGRQFGIVPQANRPKTLENFLGQRLTASSTIRGSICEVDTNNNKKKRLLQGLAGGLNGSELIG
ncbi:hypothetical protein ElyMa_000171200 [Elysia marginata]|uniref:Uncharacterized protein n=1 Tax=Elysia marginata TaxID=1093978 RepID=A0AAV4ESP8_9GAST|nr:hypothetical protein ElyMa_000171200 [Elysia marginata]